MNNSNMHIKTASQVFHFIAKTSNYEQMKYLVEQYNSFVDTYVNHSKWNMLPTIRLNKLKEFQSWLPEGYEKKDVWIPFLVSKMLEGDIYALNIYENIYKYPNAASTENIMVSYTQIHQSPELEERFNRHGASENARAMLTAELWLASHEAFRMLHPVENGDEYLCTFNAMLHLENNFVECKDFV